LKVKKEQKKQIKITTLNMFYEPEAGKKKTTKETRTSIARLLPRTSSLLGSKRNKKIRERERLPLY
jgi:hypothetical protein